MVLPHLISTHVTQNKLDDHCQQIYIQNAEVTSLDLYPMSFAFI